MTTARKNLCIGYGVIALIALVATWWHNVAYFKTGANLFEFFKQGYLNHATSSLTNDLVLLMVSAIVLMLVESHRLGVKYVWAYIALGFIVAISVAFPLFLIARERALGAREATPASS